MERLDAGDLYDNRPALKKEEEVVIATGVYQIVNQVTGRRYIGSTRQKAGCKRRWMQHRRDLRRGNHRNPYLQAEWVEYGESAFLFDIIERREPIDCYPREHQLLIAAAEAGTPLYNVWGAGCANSEEARAKLSEAMRAWLLVPAHRARHVEALRDRMRSPETRAKISAAARDRQKSPETRAKIAEATRQSWAARRAKAS